MGAIQHINNRRGGTWYFERRVPEEVKRRPNAWQSVFNGQQLYRKSLHTKNQILALEAAAAVEREFEAMVAQVTGGDHAPPPRETLPTTDLRTRVPDRDELYAIAAAERKRLVDPWLVKAVKADLDADAGRRFERDAARYLAARDGRLAFLTGRFVGLNLPDGDDHPQEVAQRVNRDHGFHLPETAQAFGVMVGIIRQAMLDADADIVRIIKGELVLPPDRSPLIANAAKVNRELAGRSPRLSEVVQHYLEAGGPKGKLAGTTVAEVRRAEQRFIATVGDKPIHEIGKADVRRFVEELAAATVGGKTAGSIARTPAKASIAKALTFLRAPVALAIAHDQVDGANPFDGVRLDGLVKAVDKRVMPDKRGMTVGELSRLLQHPWFAGCAGLDGRACHRPGDRLLDDMRFWAPIVAIFTGCRAGELGGLQLADVRLDDPSRHLVIRPNRYRGIKNDQERRVPILDVLIDLGFDRYIARLARAGADRVFPDWQPQGRSAAGEARWGTAKWIKRFNDTVVPTALAASMTEGARRPVSFHSLRGAFKQMLEDNLVPQQYVDDIVGHTKHDLDRRYSGRRSIETLFEATHRLSYKGLLLPCAREVGVRG